MADATEVEPAFQLINVNLADEDALRDVCGVGSKVAARCVQQRQEFGQVSLRLDKLRAWADFNYCMHAHVVHELGRLGATSRLVGSGQGQEAANRRLRGAAHRAGLSPGPRQLERR